MSDTTESLAPEPEEGALNPAEQIADNDNAPPSDDGATQDNQPESSPKPDKEAKEAKAKWQRQFKTWEEARLHRFTEQKAVLAGELETERRARIELEAEVRRLKGETVPNPPKPDEATIRADEQRKQTEKQEATDFVSRCNNVATKAREAYGNDAFKVVVENWADKAGLDLAIPAHRTFLADLTAMPQSAQLYYYLGSDPDLAAHLLSLPMKEQYAELRDIARTRPWLANQAANSNAEGSPPPSDEGRGAPAPAVSQAPRPAGRQPGPARTSSKSYAEMNYEEFKESRKGK